MFQRRAPLRRSLAAAVALALLGLPLAHAQYPVVWIGNNGPWLAESPGKWAFVDFSSPWKFFPDNSNGNYFFVTIPSGHVSLSTGTLPGANGLPVNFLGVAVSTLVLGNGAELTLHDQGALTIEGVNLAAGLLHNDGLMRISGASSLTLPILMPITGSGEIAMAGEQSFIAGLGVVSHDADHTLSGYGQITLGSLLNAGRLIADVPGQALKFTGGHLDNSGLLRAGGRVAGDAGGELRIKALVAMSNSGEAIAENGFLKIEGTLANGGLVESRALGTVLLSDLAIDNGGGLLRVKTGGAFMFTGSNTLKGGTLEAEPGSMLWVAGGLTELNSGITLKGLLHAEGGTLRFKDVNLAMAEGRIALAAGTVATTTGSSNSFHGGRWEGGGRLVVTTASFWDGATNAISFDGPHIDLHKATHQLAGSLVNNSTVRLRNDSGFNTPLTVLLAADTTLSGTGALVFADSNGGATNLNAASAALRLINGPEHRILGSAGNLTSYVNANLSNAGLVDSAGGALHLWSADIVNTGTLRSSAGQLRFSRGGAAQISNAGGRIEAGAGGSVSFASISNTVSGGTLAGAGELINTGSLTLDGLTQGPLTIEAGATLLNQNATVALLGEIRNEGRLQVRDGTGWLSGPVRLLVSGTVDLNGAGRLMIDGGDENLIDKATSDALLRIAAAQTLSTGPSSAGTIKVDLVNAGRVEARGANSSLAAPVASIRNTGVIAAADGASFNIGISNADTLVDNAGGRIEAAANSFITLSGGHPSVTGLVTVRGGTLAGAGRIEANRLALLQDLAIETGATVRTNSGSNLYLAGSLANEGLIDINDGTGWLSGAARLWISGEVNLTGSGRVRFFGTEGLIDKTGASSVLALGSQQTLTTDPGSAGTVNVDLKNAGRVEARGANSSLLVQAATLRNTGVLAAAEGGLLSIAIGNAPTLIDNSGGGRIEAAANSVITLSGGHPSTTGIVTVRGGTLAGAGRIDANRLALLQDLAIETGATVRTNSGSNLYLAGSIANQGLIDVHDGTDWLSGAARVWISGAVNVSGSGEIRFFGTEGVVDKSYAGSVLALGADQTLTTATSAAGTVNVDLNNAGRIEARGASSSLLAQVASLRNTGVLAATGGALFNIGIGNANTLIDNTGGGRLEAAANSFITLSGGHPSTTGLVTVLGGTLSGAGRIEANRLALLDGSGAEPLTIAAGGTVRTNSGSNLYLAGRIVNEGLIQVHDGTDWLSGNARLWINGEVQVTGAGQIRFYGTEGLIDKTSAGSLLALGAQQTLTTQAGAAGTVAVNLDNAGRVEARGLNSSLQAQVASIRNTGVLAAVEGSLFNIGLGSANTMIDNRGGRLETDALSRITLSGGHPSNTGVVTISGGTIAGAGRVDVQRFAVLDTLTIAPGATVRSSNGSSLYLAGTLINEGTIESFDGSGWLSGNAQTWVSGRAELQGSGRLLIASGDENLIGKGTGDALLVIGAAQSLTTLPSTAGTVQVNLLNQGRVEARGAGASLFLRVGAIENHGTLAAAAGADLRIGPGNANTVIANAGGRIDAGANSRVFLADAGHPANVGVTTVQGGVLGGTGTFFMQRSVLSGGVHIVPGNSPGTLSFNGTLQLDPMGALEIELAAGAHDRVNVAGAAVLAGELDLSLLAGFLPAAGEVFTFFTAQGISGSFSNVGTDGRVDFNGGSFQLLRSNTELGLTSFEAAPVPEPGALWLLLAGLPVVLKRRRTILGACASCPSSSSLA